LSWVFGVIEIHESYAMRVLEGVVGGRSDPVGGVRGFWLRGVMPAVFFVVSVVSIALGMAAVAC
jgi:hypothetical protein